MSAEAGLDALPFGEFLAVLRARGFTITVEHHLRLARLLARTGPALTPAELKGLLGPVFATDAAEQEAFHSAFEGYFGALLAPHERAALEDDEAPQIPEAASVRRFRWLPWALVATVVAAAVLLFRPPTTRRASPPAPPAPAAPADLPPANQPPPAQPTTAPNAAAPAPPSAVTPSTGARMEDFLHAHRTAAHGAAVALILVGFAWGEGRHWRRRDLLIKRARQRRPPFSWPLRVSVPQIRDLRSSPFYAAARALRRRQAGDTEHLDLRQTLLATIRRGGLPRLIYRRGSRVPEYLILIDSAAPRDHQAAYFDHLADTLAREGLFIARYFYRGDPRVCWDGRTAHTLADLRRLHPDHRLLLFGDGAGLLDPLTGAPAGWLPLLLEWRERALLTPLPSMRWGWREETLEAHLPLLPATLEALAELPDLLERGATDTGLPVWRDAAPLPPKAVRNVSVETLRAYLGDAAFDWLCACAIYPELQWHLTLFLGAQFPESGQLLSEAVLLRLVRLPWFREGALPDELRARLLAALPAERQTGLRRALVDVLAGSPPPSGSHAADARSIDIAIQRRWLGRTTQDFAAKPPAIAELPFGDQTREHSELRLHEPAADARLAFLLPRRLRAALRDKAIAPLGLRPLLRFIIAASLGLGAWLLIDRVAEQSDAESSVVDFSLNPFPTESDPAVSTSGASTPPARLATPKAPTGLRLISPSAATATPQPADEPLYAKAVPGKPGFVISPYEPGRGYIDVRGFAPGTQVKDPYSNKIFLVPPAEAPATPPPATPAVPLTGRASPYSSSADFAKYAAQLRESAMLKMEPQVIVPTTSRTLGASGKYPWKTKIVTTGFAIGYAER